MLASDRATITEYLNLNVIAKNEPIFCACCVLAQSCYPQDIEVNPPFCWYLVALYLCVRNVRGTQRAGRQYAKNSVVLYWPIPQTWHCHGAKLTMLRSAHTFLTIYGHALALLEHCVISVEMTNR